MTVCVCCAQGHPNGGAVAHEGDRWCQQCQKDGCAQPKLETGTEKVARGFWGRALHRSTPLQGLERWSGSPQDCACICHSSYDALGPCGCCPWGVS